MKCPECGHNKTRVYGGQKFETVIQRYRRCLNIECGHRWKSDEEGAQPVKRYAAREPSPLPLFEQVDDAT